MPTEHHFAFWNLENLFAPEGFAGREPWLARRIGSDLAGWTEALFRTKVEQIAKGIAALDGGRGPDVLGLCEVENRFVIDAVIQALAPRLPDRAYGAAHADATRDRRGIDTGFLYDTRRFTVDPDAIFSHFVMRRTGTRDITQITLTSERGNDIVALAHHWPSRTGGTVESAGFRATAGETLSYWHERIREERGDDIPIISLGDYNDDPWDPSLTFNARATREMGDVERARSARFYNLAWRYLTQTVTDHRGGERVIDGTLYFRNDGNVFDQILVNPSLVAGERGFQVDVSTARIETFPELVDHRVGRGPRRFGLPRGDPAENVTPDGFSDHFPVSVVVTER